jgi:hypothetical protein
MLHYCLNKEEEGWSLLTHLLQVHALVTAPLIGK